MVLRIAMIAYRFLFRLLNGHSSDGIVYEVQSFFPEQRLAYGRSNGSHPADSEGFCILSGRDVPSSESISSSKHCLTLFPIDAQLFIDDGEHR